MSDRGMKKWNAYKSLIEQDPALNAMQKKRQRIDRPVISEDVAEEINEILTQYHGQQVRIKIYKNGYVEEIESKILKIDIVERKLYLEERKSVYLKDLVGLSNLE